MADQKQGLKGPVGQPEQEPPPDYSMEDFRRDYPPQAPPDWASPPPQFQPLGSYLPGLAGGGESRLKFPTVDVDPKAWSTISRLLGSPNPDPRVEEGWVYPLFHGTLKEFLEHDPSITRDLGMHFGNLEQATRRMSKYSPGRNIRPVNVDIDNPVRLKDLFSRGFSWGKVAKEIMQSDEHAKAIGSAEPGLKLTPDEKWELMNAAHNADYPHSWNPDPRQQFWKLVEDLIHKHGHDGVVYANDLEGGGDSFIVFDPKKITPRFGSPSASQLASYPGVARTWAESQGAMPSILSSFTPSQTDVHLVASPPIQLQESGHAKPSLGYSNFVDEIMQQLGYPPENTPPLSHAKPISKKLPEWQGPVPTYQQLQEWKAAGNISLDEFWAGMNKLALSKLGKK